MDAATAETNAKGMAWAGESPGPAKSCAAAVREIPRKAKRAQADGGPANIFPFRHAVLPLSRKGAITQLVRRTKPDVM